MPSRQDYTQHPCWSERHRSVNHRSGGFGGTCERCGTLVDGPNNLPIEALRWTPIERSKPFQEGSLERAIYDVLVSVSAPLSNSNRESISVLIAERLLP